jgi:hypothetical protein
LLREARSVDGRLWCPLFPLARFALPNRVVLAWPKFLVNSAWLPRIAVDCDGGDRIDM